MSVCVLGCLSVCQWVLYVALSVCLSVCVCLDLSYCRSLRLPVYLSACLRLCVPVSCCVCWCVCLSMSLSICVYSTPPVELKWRPCQPTNQNCGIPLSLRLLEKTRLSVKKALKRHNPISTHTYCK